MEYWKILHKNTHTPLNEQFNELVNILNELKMNKSICDCQPKATEFLEEMLNVKNLINKHNLLEKNFCVLENTKFFFFHYHNLVNLKLLKGLFSIDNTISITT